MARGEQPSPGGSQAGADLCLRAPWQGRLQWLPQHNLCLPEAVDSGGVGVSTPTGFPPTPAGLEWALCQTEAASLGMSILPLLPLVWEGQYCIVEKV